MFVGVRAHTESNRKAPPITIGDFGASGFHPLVEDWRQLECIFKNSLTHVFTSRHDWGFPGA